MDRTDRIRDMQTKIDALSVELERLRHEVIGSSPMEAGPSAEAPDEKMRGHLVSRAGLLTGGAAAALGIAGAVAVGSFGAPTALAETKDSDFVATGGTGTAFSTMPGSSYSTGVSVYGSAYGVFAMGGSIGVFGNSTSSDNGVYGSSDGNASGVFGYGASYGGVEGESVSGYGVYGHSGNIGVYGTSAATTTGLPIGVSGFCATSIGVQGVSTSGTGVEGSSNSGYGVVGESDSSAGVFGTSSGNSPGVTRSSNGGPGVQGNGTVSPGVVGMSDTDAGLSGTSTNAPGIRGISMHGRGGVFSGKAAAVNLVPAGGAHPNSGDAGDLFVDKSHRLWFCTKRGKKATWKQVVLQ